MCDHEQFAATVDINRVIMKNRVRFNADLRIECGVCGVSFRFIGLPHGLDLNGAAVSIDGEEAHLCIAPEGEVITAIDEAEVTGFTVKRTI